MSASVAEFTLEFAFGIVANIISSAGFTPLGLCEIAEFVLEFAALLDSLAGAWLLSEFVLEFRAKFAPFRLEGFAEFSFGELAANAAPVAKLAMTNKAKSFLITNPSIFFSQNRGVFGL